MIGFFVAAYLFAVSRTPLPMNPTFFLRYSNDEFEIAKSKDGPAVARVPRVAPIVPLDLEEAFRNNQTFAVWDERGLTIRNGKRVISSHLEGIPTSPRLRSHDDILTTLKAKQDDGRSLKAGGLSGAKRVGKSVYLLVRWQDAPGRPWLECLVKVDLSSPDPAPQAIIIIPGFTFATKLIDDDLYAAPGKLYTYIQKGDSWGAWDYDLKTGEASYQTLGKNPVSITMLENQRIGFVERSDQDTFYTGIFDPASESRIDLQEFSSQPVFVKDASGEAIVRVMQRGHPAFVDLDTGATLLFSSSPEVLQTQYGLLFYGGGAHPVRAWLYSPKTWAPLAWWSK